MKDMNLNAILILAAGYRVYNESFNLKEPFLNIGNTLIIERIKKYISTKQEIYIAVNQFPEEYKKLNVFSNCNFLDVGDTNGVISTIKKSIELISERYINIIPITTIPDNNFENKNKIFFGDKKLSKENWSGILYENEINIKYFYKEDIISFKKKCYPFTGRISSEKSLIVKALKKIKKDEIKDLLFLAKILIEKYKFEIIHEKWYDSGHSATYFETKISSFSSRFFNEVSYCKTNNSIIKKSENKSKIKREKDFYTKIPNNLKHYFPVILNCENETTDLLQLEYLPFPNLSEIFLFRKLDPNGWESIVNSINKIYHLFYGDKNQNFIYENASFLYTEKLKNRINYLEKIASKTKNKLLLKILNDGLKVNNTNLPSLNQTILEINKNFYNFEKSRPLFFGHGDLCFNNILVEPLSGCIKLIDPKAEIINNKRLGFMDPYYDLAKLNHSFSCLYDSIVNNLFYLSIKKESCILKIIKPKNYEVANFYFKEILIKNSKIDKNLLRMLTSNLFLSMSPLHQEDANKMCTFLIIGISIFYNVKLDIYMQEI